MVPIDDYSDPVVCPQYLSVKRQSNVSSLSEGTRVYDYVVDSGARNLGSWVDTAAVQVGR
jgi:hypothetical protein